MFKKIIQYGLSILFLSITLHVDMHSHENFNGYSICDFDCDKKQHHSIAHQCEKCLNKNTRLITQKSSGTSLVLDVLLMYRSDENFNYNYSNFYLYSRPPPILL